MDFKSRTQCFGHCLLFIIINTWADIDNWEFSVWSAIHKNFERVPAQWTVTEQFIFVAIIIRTGMARVLRWKWIFSPTKNLNYAYSIIEINFVFFRRLCNTIWNGLLALLPLLKTRRTHTFRIAIVNFLNRQTDCDHCSPIYCHSI